VSDVADSTRITVAAASVAGCSARFKRLVRLKRAVTNFFLLQKPVLQVTISPMESTAVSIKKCYFFPVSCHFKIEERFSLVYPLCG